MARLAGDNGKPDDTAIKDILSPFSSDRSALTDCEKVLLAPEHAHRAVLIYGFDWLPAKPIQPLIEAFESLAPRRVLLGKRVERRFENLVHPVHRSGAICAWEIRRA